MMFKPQRTSFMKFIGVCGPAILPMPSLAHRVVMVTREEKRRSKVLGSKAG